MIRETSSGGFVALELDESNIQTVEAVQPESEQKNGAVPPELYQILATPEKSLQTAEIPTWDRPVTSVFVSHGKNQRILDQVKQIVLFGKFQAVISKDKETVSKPVPDKVMDDMRSCQAAVIHVASEGALIDQDGNPTTKINENVLIEIGAAMALYRRRFILLVEDGLTLPSNLQGLYEVRYKGDALDGDSTMKLLKAFNDFSSIS